MDWLRKALNFTIGAFNRSAPIEPQPQLPIDNTPVLRRPTMSTMKRGVGYCLNNFEDEVAKIFACEDYSKGVFLLNHGDEYFCSRCRLPGVVVKEVGVYEEISDTAPYKEVRVEYNYDIEQERYRDVAIVRDESIWGAANKYILYSPLIRTDKRALKVAESILSNLQQTVSKDDDPPRSAEIVVNFDDPYAIVENKLKALGEEWSKHASVVTNWDKRNGV